MVWVTRAAVLIAAGACWAAPGLAHEIKSGALVLHHPWVHAAAKGAASTDGFLVIKNTGTTPDRLLGATINGVGPAVVVQPGGAAGASGLCRLEQGIEIAPGATVVLKPGTAGLMFSDVSASLREDTYADGTLMFAKAGHVKIEFFVQAADSVTPSHSAQAGLAACGPTVTQ